MNIEKFRQDHAAILVSIETLRQWVQAGVIEHAEEIARAIVSMSSSIKLHLAAEDRMLYPTLVNSTDPEVARIATGFQCEMGSLAGVYMEFSRRWNLAAKVAADADGFRREANQVFKALHERIQRENQELYALVERA